MNNGNGSDKGAPYHPRCGWCGEILTETNAARPREFVKRERERNICADCEAHREWLLKCIRYSDHVFKYVTRVEAREAPRRARARPSRPEIMLAAPELPLVTSHPPTEADISAAVQRDFEKRMVNVESMLSKLVRALDEQGRNR